MAGAGDFIFGQARLEMTERQFQTLAKPLMDDLADLFSGIGSEIQQIIREGGTPDEIENKIVAMLGGD
jgi:hypothetical protein